MNPFPTPAPDFSDPLGLLRACHDRILNHCTTLERLPAYLARHGVDGEFESAVAAIQRYFTTAGRHHHVDESADLFPLLRGNDAALDRLVDELEQQHTALERHWDQLAAALSLLSEVTEQELAARIEPFIALQREHVARENGELLPAAATHLTADQRQRLARAMAKRRGVTLG